MVLDARIDDVEVSRSSGLPACRGFAPDGRLLFCAWEQIDELNAYPTTAYEIGEDA